MEPRVIGKAFANFRGGKEQIDIISVDSVIAGRHKDVGYDDDSRVIVYLDRSTGEYIGVIDDTPDNRR